MIPVVLSGGSGTRLWPISRAKYPKQFCHLFPQSLQSQTLQRLRGFGVPMIVTSRQLMDLTVKNLRDLGLMESQVLYEPVGKNTAPAIALLCRVLQMQKRDHEVVGIFPADHLVERTEEFHEAIRLAEKCAHSGKVATLGLKPTYPETGYGYIQTEKESQGHLGSLAAFAVVQFHEKPSREVAQSFLQQGSYWWNAGIFVFQAKKMIEHFQRFQPQIWQILSSLKNDLSNLREVYEQLPSISIDYGILERLSTSDLACVPCNPGWSDVGSWDAVAQVYERGSAQQNWIEVDSKNNFAMSEGNKRSVFVGVDDLIVVDTQDAMLITKRGHTQDVKLAVEKLKAEKSRLTEEHTFEERPWGRFDILRDTDRYKSKVISVSPSSQISYQSHAKREEHWIVVGGAGEVVLNDDVIPVKYGSYIKIPQGAKHRIRNTGVSELEFIEVQLGSYFGEDDIIRYADDYRRAD